MKSKGKVACMPANSKLTLAESGKQLGSAPVATKDSFDKSGKKL